MKNPVKAVNVDGFVKDFRWHFVVKIYCKTYKKYSKYDFFTMNIINWSGGHDSTVMLHHLLQNREAIEPFKVMFVDSTITVPETIEYMSDIIHLFGIQKEFGMLKPKETFYSRLFRYNFWPSIRALWCRKILKLDPIKDFYNSFKEPITEFIGISIHDSGPRKRLYSKPKEQRKWGKKIVIAKYPILQWTDQKKKLYMNQNNIPRNPVYNTLRLSGCYFCPFYHEPDFLTSIW